MEKEPKQLTKMETLASIEGMSVDVLLEEAVFDTCYGICKNPGCSYTMQLEPDNDAGWCAECNDTTVVSCLRMAGIC